MNFLRKKRADYRKNKKEGFAVHRQSVLLCALLAAATAADALYAANRSPMPAETAVSDVPIENAVPATPTNHPPRFLFDLPLAEQPRAAGEIPAEPPIAVQPPEQSEESATAPAEAEASAPESSEPAQESALPAPQEPEPSSAEPPAADDALQRLAAVEKALAQRVDLLAQELLRQSGGDSARLAALAKDAAAQFDAIEQTADREAEAIISSLDGAAAKEARGAYLSAKAAQLGYWRALIADGGKKAGKNADDFQISP